jgi:hypothetical protein
MLYTANVAAECLFKMGVQRGYWPSLSNGPVIVFALAWAILSYLYKHSRGDLDNASNIVGTVVSEENKPDRWDRMISDKLNAVCAVLPFQLPTSFVSIYHTSLLAFLMSNRIHFSLRHCFVARNRVHSWSIAWSGAQDHAHFTSRAPQAAQGDEAQLLEK